MTDLDKTQEQPPTPACIRNYDINDPLQQEVTCVFDRLKNDIMGIIALGNDGVLRSLTADRRVLSAEGLRHSFLPYLDPDVRSSGPELIEAFLRRFPEDYVKRAQEQGLKTSDGTKTAKEKWFKPDEDILPPPLPQEELEKARNMPEDQKELLRQRMREREK
ncbi:hypothetical protein P153DRAFT_303983 [Dothidotthia symphoricarpi CBS 119687]|uniref:Uncharacterized protein n=1 Tax=Dothidotthia symphoricarpi CBS 119687 TaxID=1392245 RepID=A0A6A5ZYI7_9PLEO|nr:uncharacterized protein P153DRAFT_303983 [Dothidotthia symphoricarpi CBS 119687]KAF2123381.1 hypothetical protein P153DRAFT_303983 [Dothidotthia symphoricarpi CBS 119687]